MTHSMRNKRMEVAKTVFMIFMLGLIWFTAFRRDQRYGKYRQCLDRHYDVAACKKEAQW